MAKYRFMIKSVVIEAPNIHEAESKFFDLCTEDILEYDIIEE